jgi:predicted nucleic acid-binding protein
VFVDSGAWIALFSARDRHHLEVDRLFREAAERSSRLLTTNLVLAEVHRFQLFHAGAAAAARVLDRIDASRLVTVTFAGRAHHVAARAWLAKLPDQALSYVDAVSFAVMRSERLNVALSFDPHFSLAGFRLWPHEA